MRVFRVSFFQKRPNWKAHREGPTGGLPARGARISQKQEVGCTKVGDNDFCRRGVASCWGQGAHDFR